MDDDQVSAGLLVCSGHACANPETETRPAQQHHRYTTCRATRKLSHAANTWQHARRHVTNRHDGDDGLVVSDTWKRMLKSKGQCQVL